MTRRRRTLLLMAASLLLAPGCSGKKRTYAPPPEAAVPTLVASSPRDGQRLVPRDARPLTATFSTGLDPSTVASALTLVDAGGRALPGDAALLDSRTVAFTPLGLLPGASALELRVSTDLHASGGRALLAPVAVAFRSESAARAGALLINEVYGGTRDSQGLPGDTNPALDEQFVELVNVSPVPLDLYGVVLSTTARPRAHVFAQRLLPPGAAVVVWAHAPDRPGAVQASSGALALSLATGDRVRLESTELSTPEVVDEVAFPTPLVDQPTTSESITRLVDAAVGDSPGGRYVLHSRAPGAIGGFSPGARVDGSPYPVP